MLEATGTFLDLENLFTWRNFEEDGEYPQAHGDMIDGAEVLVTYDADAHPELHAAAAKHPSLAVVPKYVDLFVTWLDRGYQVEARRTFGKKWDLGVKAARERFRAHGFGFTPAANGADAADSDLVRALRDATRAGRFPIYLVGSSDAKQETPGIIPRAIDLVDQSRRVRLDGSRLVVVLGPSRISPGEHRWNSRDDLGPTDEVHKLSRIVYNELKNRRTRPYLSPRAALPPLPRQGVLSRKKWAQRIAAWSAEQNDALVEAAMRASFGGAQRHDHLTRSFGNFDGALASPPDRARLRPIAGRVVNELLESLPRPVSGPAIAPGVATFPASRHGRERGE